jgi:hypothetical protein
MSNAMFAAFAEAGILAPIEINIQLDEATRYTLPGFFSISQEGLSQLSGETLQALHRSGFLALAYCVILSTGNMGRLIEIKSRRRQNP